MLDHPRAAAQLARAARAGLGNRFDATRLGVDLEETYMRALTGEPTGEAGEPALGMIGNEVGVVAREGFG
jgi:hypothetical protein